MKHVERNRTVNGKMGQNRRPEDDPAVKRILILISSIGGGGAERVASRLANGLSEKHFVCLMIFNRKEKTYELSSRVRLIEYEKPRAYKSRLFRIGKIRRQADKLAVLKAVADVRREYEIDTTISFLESQNVYNVLAGGGTRRIVSERNDPSCKDSHYRRRSRYSCGRADFVVFQSRKVQAMYPASVQARSCIIHNPVEVACRAAEEPAKKIVTAGRLVDQKNHRLLIRAFAIFRENHPDHHLYIYGEGELEKDLAALAEELGLADQVHLEGFREDVYEEMRDAEQFVLSSDFEGLSNALMEAMQMGLACISTDCTGSDELIQDGKDGLIVPVGDADAMARAMCRLAEDPDLRRQIGRAAAATAVQWLPEKILEEWERIL